MMLDEMVCLFLDSRKRGTTGARKKCSPKTLAIYQANLRQLLVWLSENGGVLKYSDFKRLVLLKYLDWMDSRVSKGEWSRATVLQNLRVLRSFFRWVEKDDDCKAQELKSLRDYLPVIEKCPRRTDIPQLIDLKRFKNSFNTSNKWGLRDYVVTCLLLTNGLRIGEVANLTLDNLRFEEKTLIVTGKTGTRLVPITNDMIRLFKLWLKRRQTCRYAADSPYVFVSKRSPQMCQHAFSSSFLKHRKKHGLPRISPHTFRHAFCTHYLKNGGDIEKLRSITGHTSYQMLLDYLHLAKIGGKAVQEELERVNLLKEV